MSIRIMKPGFLSTIQDQGRWGYQSYGVPVGGAMDTDALGIANILVGNDEGSCGIEFTMHTAEIECEEDSLIAICGGGALITINDREAPFWKPVCVRKNSVLKFRSHPTGCRSYLAIAGGFRVNKIMNSASTYLPSGFGGHEGRMLQQGDRIEVDKRLSSLSSRIFSLLNPGSESFAVASWGFAQEKGVSEKTIRIIEGPEWNWISENAKYNLLESKFLLLPSSNRMACKLQGEKLQRVNSQVLISAAVSKGTIQCTPDGDIILLMADCQTTGGYPRIAHAATADLSLCAQCRAGEYIRFSIISFAEAEQLLLERQHTFRELKRGIAMRLGL